MLAGRHFSSNQNNKLRFSALNPVLDISAMFHLTDIPDWCYFEGTGKWTDFKTLPDEEERQQMFNSSPIAHLDKIKTPYLLLIGEKDLRVAPHWKSFIRNLKARKIPTNTLVYDSNHQLGEVEVECDWSINLVRWFDEHAK